MTFSTTHLISENPWPREDTGRERRYRAWAWCPDVKRTRYQSEPPFLHLDSAGGKNPLTGLAWELGSITCRACSCHTKVLSNYFLFFRFPVLEQHSVPGLRNLCSPSQLWSEGQQQGGDLQASGHLGDRRGHRVHSGASGVLPSSPGDPEVDLVSAFATEKHKNLDPPIIDFSI